MTTLIFRGFPDACSEPTNKVRSGPAPSDGVSLGRALADQINSGAVRGPVRRLPAGSHLYRMGDSPDWICLIRRGWIKSLSPSRQGKLCMLGVEGPGAVLGAVRDQAGVRGEDVVTKTEVAFNVIPRADFERCLASPLFSAPWRQHMNDLMSERQGMLTSFVTLDSQHRLAATLLHLASKWGTPHDGMLRLVCSLTHEELGQMVGTTRSRVGFFINRFDALGLVTKLRDKLAVHPEPMLRYLHG